MERERLQVRAQDLYEKMIRLLRLYGSSGAPYASANVPAMFTTLACLTTAATAVITGSIMKGAAGDDYIGVAPPSEFLVEGRHPRLAA